MIRYDQEDRDLERLLERYAAEQLSPSPSARRRLRARWSGPDRRGRTSLHRLATALAAAGLTVLLTMGGVVAAEPGGPLYPVRIWAETVVMPSGEGGRARAGILQLDARLAEAAGAAERQNGRGAAAALDAYQALIESAVEAAGSDAVQLEHLEDALGRQRLVLESLAGQVPGPAMPALQRAIEAGDRTVVEIERGKSGDAPRGRGPGSTTSPGGPPARGFQP